MAKLNRQEDFPHHEERNGKLSWKYCHVFQMLNFGHKLFCHLSFKDKRMLKIEDQIRTLHQIWTMLLVMKRDV